MELRKEIRFAANGNQQSKKFILQKFEPLISKYSRELEYEEANTDLIIAMLESIEKIDKSLKHDSTEAQCISYIHKTLNRKKIDLLRRLIRKKSKCNTTAGVY